MMNQLRSSVMLLLLAVLSYSLKAQTGNTFKQWGTETFSQIDQDFRLPNSNLYRETTSTQNIAFNWPIGVQLHALIAGRKIAMAEALANEIHDKYWCFTNNRWGYNASANSCGDRYYDDNAWMAKALMELYQLTSNTTYLNRAKETIAFSMSGENRSGESPGGGIKWHEGDTEGQCLCGTAPTMVTNLMIYQATGEQQYYTDGLRLYNWVKANRFGLGGGYRGYENAVITQAAIRLFQISGNQTYYNDAKHMGLAMETVYINYNTHALAETGQWGGHDMSAAYVELYNLDGDPNWLNIAAGFLNYLHTNCKDGAGRYPEWWNDPEASGNPALLYQASAARGFAEMGNTPGGSIKQPDPVAIFRDVDYAGFYSTGLPIGKYTTADLEFRGMPDNQITSVKVRDGYKITMYLNDNFQGDSLVRTSNSNYVGATFNDNISSVKVEVVSPTAVFYKDCNFNGQAVNLTAGDYSLTDLQAFGLRNKDISSIALTSGYEVTLYKGANLNGESITITANNSCLVGNSWNDSTSSLSINCSSTPITPYLSINGGSLQATDEAAVSEGGSVTLSPQPNDGSWSWNGPNFSSSQRQVTLSNLQQSQSGIYTATNTSSTGCIRSKDFSITVQPTYAATLFADCNYGGASAGLAVGDYDMFALINLGMANDVASSLKVAPGYEIEVFQDYNFTGASYTFTADDNCLDNNGIDNWISSAKVRAATNNFSTLIEAEDYSSMSGIQTENTTDTGGGLNVGYIEAGDWMAYTNVNIPSSGNYLIEYRVASMSGGGRLSLDLDAGATVLGEVGIPSTGGWQNWTTVSQTVSINAGTYSLGVYAQNGGWNINWIQISSASTVTGAREATKAMAKRVADVTIYPNPAESEITIQGFKEAEKLAITVINSKGQPVKTATTTNHTLDISDLRPGIYLLQISDSKTTLMKRFVKE
ncbi:carbohydrate-binding protein [Fulvivirga ligni]|uniref:carbohydrate-binding protein n=1 Tax=Fulvivirga ligni TaxID=2904246 RepID=UPI001F2E48DE|nr:carbohydrate-binding protein [Fulvivirga ligni]UII22318.1 carbohydrate-binding protein [Fulvivirga ligni]